MIDQDRVAQLELMERLDHVKKNWDKLTYAEQFIHLWMSGAVFIVRKTSAWDGLGISFRDRTQVLWRLIWKWSRDRDLEVVDFLSYLDASLE